MSRWAGRALLAALAVLGALNVVWVVKNWHAVVSVSGGRGSSAPDFEAPLLAGGKFHLADERGHPVVLVFWASWCQPCQHELPMIDAFAKRIAGSGAIRIVTVNVENDRALAQAAVDRLHLSLPVALEDGSASSAFSVSTIPKTVVIDATGHIADVLSGATSEESFRYAIGRVVGDD